MEMVKIRDLTFHCNFSCVSNYTPLLYKDRFETYCHNLRTILHDVLPCTRVNKAAACTMTNLMEMVKIRDLTFQCNFSCVFNYTPLLYKDRFETYCHNLRTNLMDIVII